MAGPYPQERGGRGDRQLTHLRTLHKADAHVVQWGTPGDPADLSVINQQEKWYYQIEYNTLYNVPSNWIPVAQVYSGPDIGVTYNIIISYVGRADFTLQYTHRAV